MTDEEKKEKLQNLINGQRVNGTLFYRTLEATGDLKNDYSDYLTTKPINCDEELKRLPTADYELCAVLLTMLLREDHFSEGSFVRRYTKGQVQLIVQRMIDLLS